MAENQQNVLKYFSVIVLLHASLLYFPTNADSPTPASAVLPLGNVTENGNNITGLLLYIGVGLVLAIGVGISIFVVCLKFVKSSSDKNEAYPEINEDVEAYNAPEEVNQNRSEQQ